MKFSSKASAFKTKKQPTKSAGAHSHAGGVSPRWWPLPRAVILSLCMLLACGGTWASIELLVWNTLPAALVGRWEVVSGPPEYSEATFEFFRNGVMEATINPREMIQARVKVDGDKIYSTTRHPDTRAEHTQVQWLRSLTATELVVEDQNGLQTRMIRIP